MFSSHQTATFPLNLQWILMFPWFTLFLLTFWPFLSGNHTDQIFNYTPDISKSNVQIVVKFPKDIHAPQRVNLLHLDPDWWISFCMSSSLSQENFLNVDLIYRIYEWKIQLIDEQRENYFMVVFCCCGLEETSHAPEFKIESKYLLFIWPKVGWMVLCSVNNQLQHQGQWSVHTLWFSSTFIMRLTDASMCAGLMCPSIICL